jgi:hypothetical protein
MTDPVPPPARRRAGRAAYAASVLSVAAILIVPAVRGSQQPTTTACAPAGGPPEELPANAADPVLTCMLAEAADFPADADPRPVLVLRQYEGPPEFRSGDGTSAFGTGNWEGPTALPQTPAEADGYPVISAAEALTRLRKIDGGASGPPQGRLLRVSDMRLGSVDTHTDRGIRRLPAWAVTFDGALGPTWIPAIAAPARYLRPALDHDSYWDMDLSADGRTVTLALGSDAGFPMPCDSTKEMRIAESDHAVATRLVTVPRTPQPGEKPGDCEQHTVSGHLAKPLGNRILLAANGDQTEVINVGPAAR